jgi:hypothetical protein
MKFQIIQDGKGNNTGVFIPIEDWAFIKANYPDIDSLAQEIPEWQKKILDNRLDSAKSDPNTLKPIDDLFNELDS